MPSPDSPGQKLLAFANALPGTDFLYLLLDPLAPCPAGGALGAQHLSQTLGPAQTCRVPRQMLAHSPAHQPLLCQLAGPGQALAEATFHASLAHACTEQSAVQRYVCGWLHSVAPMAEVGRHLARQAGALSEAGGTPLAWYEPLRLELLASILSDGLSGVLGPVQGWWAPTSWGSLQQWTAAGVATDAQCINAEQALAQVPLIKRLLRLWRAAQLAPLGHFTHLWHGATPLPPNAASQALAMILQARSLGLRDSSDLLSLCLYRACAHPRLHAHPQVRLHIEEAAQGVCSLPAAFSRYSDAQWQQMITELGGGEPPQPVSQTLPRAGAAPGRTG